MRETIQKLVGEIWGRPERRGLFLGLDSSGRTTALYRLVLGKTVPTIPTIGFNVETVRHGGVDFTAWDVGGCDKIRPLWRHYFANSDWFFFFVDCNDRCRLNQARDELNTLLQEEELQGIFFCVAANKQDFETAMSAPDLASFLGLKDRIASGGCTVVPTIASEGKGLREMMDTICNATMKKEIESVEKKPSQKEESEPGPDKADEDPLAKKIEDTLLDWLEQEDGDDDDFLQQLADYTLGNWDHRTHLRIAWLLLSRHGRREGMKLIFDGIRNFIANSKRTLRSRGTTFHETMTYFWIHMVHYAMETTATPRNDFKTFLLLNPQLANGGLFLHYYSKKLMLQTAASRMEVMLPDIRPLPSIITDMERLSKEATTKGVSVVPRAAPLSDEEFFQQWREGKLTSWGHESRLRAIWLCLKRYGRREGVQNTFEGLEAFENSGHHVTLAYFWIQMTDYVMRKLGDEEIPTFGIFIQKPPAQQLRNPDLINKYYSPSNVGVLGKKEFKIPDKKPLPSVI